MSNYSTTIHPVATKQYPQIKLLSSIKLAHSGFA